VKEVEVLVHDVFRLGLRLLLEAALALALHLRDHVLRQRLVMPAAGPRRALRVEQRTEGEAASVHRIAVLLWLVGRDALRAGAGGAPGVQVSALEGRQPLLMLLVSSRLLDDEARPVLPLEVLQVHVQLGAHRVDGRAIGAPDCDGLLVLDQQLLVQHERLVILFLQHRLLLLQHVEHVVDVPLAPQTTARRVLE